MFEGIITADWHLRLDKPRCRLDADWMGAQQAAVRFVVDLSNEKQLPIYLVGDLFHVAKPDDLVVNMLIDELSRAKFGFWVLGGNHDFLWHSEKYAKNSAIWPFLAGHIVNTRPIASSEEVVFTHQLVFASEKDRPFEGIGILAKDLLKKYPKAEWVFTGDNHRSFIYVSPEDHPNQMVINPGCLLRQTADLKDYQPVIVKVDKNGVEYIHVPDSENLVTDEYLVEAEERTDRIAAFIERLGKSETSSLSFLDNLRDKMRKTDAKVVQMVEEVLEKAEISF